ncbi:hypothetical protein AMTR_s00070p00126280 [Amborella trichopoda]|uniref:Uncharacterized protein n=1 Tax=Amborella trichopoda TaxID=13333 RepID=U5D4V3_AMBTC|nr:hypothetical protein AMTR_s00070p00126280 [Amborella trichopoda]
MRVLRHARSTTTYVTTVRVTTMYVLTDAAVSVTKAHTRAPLKMLPFRLTPHSTLDPFTRASSNRSKAATTAPYPARRKTTSGHRRSPVTAGKPPQALSPPHVQPCDHWKCRRTPDFTTLNIERYQRSPKKLYNIPEIPSTITASLLQNSLH